MKNATKMALMYDIETLDTGPDSVVTQIAFIAYDLADPETPVRVVSEFLPIQPQFALNRTVSADTLIWWMQQEDAARLLFQQNTGNDMDELLALVRSVVRKTNQVLDEAGDYEIWAKGPQFDIVNLESLIEACGEEIPWKYDRVRDLRTLMKLADVSTGDVTPSRAYVKHIAVDDCAFQIDCYVEALRRIRAVD